MRILGILIFHQHPIRLQLCENVTKGENTVHAGMPLNRFVVLGEKSVLCLQKKPNPKQTKRELLWEAVKWI